MRHCKIPLVEVKLFGSRLSFWRRIPFFELRNTPICCPPTSHITSISYPLPPAPSTNIGLSNMDQLKHRLFGQPDPPTTSLLITKLQRLAESIYTNPLNLLLLLALLYILIPLIRPSSPTSSRWTPTPAEARSHLSAPSDRYTYLPSQHPDTVEWTKYIPRTLAVFDGTGNSSDSDGSRILLAINRKVFDVTKGKTFYGPGGPYGNFAGRDASRGMAKQSFDMEMLTPLDQPIDKLEDLTPSEL